MAQPAQIDPIAARRGGTQWSRPKAQFLAIYDKIGIFMMAAREAGWKSEEHGRPVWDLDEGMILWPNDNRPSLGMLRMWAEDLDDGKYEIPEAVKRRMNQRLANRFDATVRQASLDVIRSNAATVRHLNEKAQSDTLSAEMSPILQHANNGVQNTVRALKESLQRGEDAPKKVGKMKIKQAKPRLAAGNVAVGEYREVDARVNA